MILNVLENAFENKGIKFILSSPLLIRVKHLLVPIARVTVNL